MKIDMSFRLKNIHKIIRHQPTRTFSLMTKLIFDQNGPNFERTENERQVWVQKTKLMTQYFTISMLDSQIADLLLQNESNTRTVAQILTDKRCASKYTLFVIHPVLKKMVHRWGMKINVLTNEILLASFIEKMLIQHFLLVTSCCRML